MRTSLLVLVFVGGCQLVFQPPDANIVVPGTPFLSPEEVVLEPPQAERIDPSLTDDLLELYYSEDAELRVARRSTTEEPFGQPSILTDLSSVDDDDLRPCVSRDGLRIYFTRRVPQTTDEDLFFSERGNRDALWNVPVKVEPLSTSGRERCGWESPDRKQLHYACEIDTRMQLCTATRVSPEVEFEPGTVIAGLSSSDSDLDPSATDDGSIVVFGSNRVDEMEIYETYQTATLRVIEPRDELGSAGHDGEPWLSADGHTIAFSSDRDGGVFKIYIAYR